MAAYVVGVGAPTNSPIGWFVVAVAILGPSNTPRATALAVSMDSLRLGGGRVRRGYRSAWRCIVTFNGGLYCKMTCQVL